MIPRLIHFIWVGGPMPAWAERNIDAFRRMHPNHEVRVHGEEVLRPDYADRYASLPSWSDKSDLLRYSLLERFGGWYVDADMYPLRPLDEVERAWCLDGSRLFLAEQTRRDRPHWLNGAVLACEADWPGWETLRREALATSWTRFGDLGPQFLTRFGKAHPDRVEIAGQPWFYGVEDHRWAAKVYGAVLRGKVDAARRWMPETGGQLPYLLHLWSYRHSEQIAAGAAGASSVRPAALVIDRPEWFPGQRALFDALSDGLGALGYRVERRERAPDALLEAGTLPDLLAIWNGIRSEEARLVDQARRFGSQVLYLEHGFWQRSRYVQCDLRGTQHRASWAEHLAEPAPPEGAGRLAAFYPDGIRRIRARKQGYVLVLGQVPKDSQMDEAELRGPLPLQRAVKGALPRGVAVCFRPHPQCANVTLPAHKNILPLLNPSGGQEAAQYKTTKAGAGLAEALAGARFVITVNSTAGNEALAAGVPVLAFGPALYLAAGVARQATLKTLRSDIEAMLAGWCPKPSAVQHYLRRLASRQWNAEELRSPEVLGSILGREPIEARDAAGGG
jgi:hypothetical protein